MRNYLVKRDRYRRRLFYKYERIKLFYKFLRITDKENALYYSRIISSFPADSSITRVRNFCILSHRARGVYKDFKLSRMFIKQLVGLGMLNGIKKASW